MLSVVICTWNRASLLRRSLASHVTAHLPSNLPWEIVVVDNGSMDDTANVIKEFAGRLPIRGVYEPKLGLSHARNAGVREARGEYVLWTDDDVIISPNWLISYADAIEQWPEASFFGGPVVPLFDNAPPRWLVEALPVIGNAYALVDLGTEVLPFTQEDVPFGANYAVRMTEQRRYMYSPELGRRGNHLAGGEETMVVRSILRDGGTGWYLPSAMVHHVISKERQSVHYLRRYYFENSVSGRYINAEGVAMLFGRPRWLWRTAVEQELLYRMKRVVAPPKAWAPHLREASEGWGALRVPVGLVPVIARIHR